jgi:hypothetical protein
MCKSFVLWCWLAISAKNKAELRSEAEFWDENGRRVVVPQLCLASSVVEARIRRGCEETFVCLRFNGWCRASFANHTARVIVQDTSRAVDEQGRTEKIFIVINRSRSVLHHLFFFSINCRTDVFSPYNVMVREGQSTKLCSVRAFESWRKIHCRPK